MQGIGGCYKCKGGTQNPACCCTYNCSCCGDCVVPLTFLACIPCLLTWHCWCIEPRPRTGLPPSVAGTREHTPHLQLVDIKSYVWQSCFDTGAAGEVLMVDARNKTLAVFKNNAGANTGNEEPQCYCYRFI